MKLQLLALSGASSALIGAEAFVSSSVNQQHQSTTTALNNYKTKWSPASSGAAPCPYHASPSASASSSADYAEIRAELASLMDNPSWDDGSLAPVFLRLAWHSSGTYDAASGTGGSNGAGMRFNNPEAGDPENAGLDAARAFLEPVKKKFPS
eukprot:140640_1